MFIIDNGILLSCGNNQLGQLGLGHYDNRDQFEKVNNDNYFIMVSCSYHHTIALDIDGNLWGCGCNNTGELGLGTYFKCYNEFIRIPSITTFKSVTCSYCYSIALDIDGYLWVCGYNMGGLLGNNDVGVPISLITAFTKINIETKFRYLSFTKNNTMMAIDTEGNLWGSGTNRKGELGLGHDNIVSNFTKVDGDINFTSVESGNGFAIAIDADGNLFGCGMIESSTNDDDLMYNLGWKFSQISNGVKFIDISCGNSYFVAIDDTGCLWSYGGNVYGELGLEYFNRMNELTKITSDKTFIAVSCKDYDTYALDSEGYIWTCGQSRYINILTMIKNVKADSLFNNHIRQRIPTKGSYKF